MSQHQLAEQPDEWTEPGAHPVLPGITRIPLPMPHSGLEAVNVYVLEADDGLVLVDSGWAIPEAHRALGSSLAEVGARPSDVHTALVTHAHHDHYTVALDLQVAHGCQVLLGRDERPSVDEYGALRRNHADGAPLDVVQVELLRRHGADELATYFGRVRDEELTTDPSPWGLPDTWLDHGDVVGTDELALEVLATPGHTRGHVVLRAESARLLFSGDHVLPHITPSLGFEAAPERLPLQSYLHSLRLVRHREETLLLPAHGPVQPSTHGRIDELLDHHAQRLAACRDRVMAGDATAFEVARAIPWTTRGTRFDDLSRFNRCLAVLETGAHLDVLAFEGDVVMSHDQGRRIYEPGGDRSRRAG